MGITPDAPLPLVSAGRELSPEAQAAALWFRHLARGLKTARLYRTENPTVRGIRDQIADTLTEQLERCGAWKLRFTSSEIRFDDEVLVRPGARKPGGEAPIVAPEEQMPFLFYRDGVRGMTLQPGISRREIDALFEALRLAGSSAMTQDDLVTLLWQANLTHVQIEAVPLEQTIFLSSRRGRAKADPGFRGQTYAWSPSGSEIHADLGQIVGAQGLHRDTFDDWPLPEVHAQTPQAYRALLPVMEALRAGTLAAWEDERAIEWTEQAPLVLRQLLAFDAADDTRQSVSHAAMSWVASAIQRSAWEEASQALELLCEFDPDRSRSGTDLAAVLKRLNSEEIAEQLDEVEPEVQARFASLMVALGPPAVDLACAVLSTCTRARARAAASTALMYLCSENPRLLVPQLASPHWYVVRNVVFVLGQIGGSAVLDMLRSAAQHPESRVRRQVVMALGSVSRAERTPVLMSMLTTEDPQLLAATLNMLTRDPNPRVVRAILDRIAAPRFDDLSEENQRALFAALAEMADDSLVPDLEKLLRRGGWLSRPSRVHIGAARTLRRIGSERAIAVLEAGLRARNEQVRVACLDALSRKTSA